MTIYSLVESKTEGYELRGGPAAFWKSRDPEVIIEGPAETGKTFGGLMKLDALCWKYPGAQISLVRKTYGTMAGTVCQTFAKVAKMDAIRVLGESRPERYIYPTGSVIWLGGMDNPSKTLSGERDAIYINQAEELALDDWEILSTRTTGRAAHMPYSQLMGDCNPGPTTHWIRERAKTGRLRLIKSIHQDNPTLYDSTGNLTERGRKTLQQLEGLTGVRRQRLLLGQWATAEGAVYDMFSSAVHVQARDPKEFVLWGMAVDEGYTNPAVILLIGIDGDGRLHVYREFYERGRLQSEIVGLAHEWHKENNCYLITVDEAAAGLIADMRSVGLGAVGAKGRVQDGIRQVQDALKVAGDGKPRLTVDPSCINTINEFESYIWKPEKDEPIKENDHAMDAVRYFIHHRSLYGGWLMS